MGERDSEHCNAPTVLLDMRRPRFSAVAYGFARLGGGGGGGRNEMRAGRGLRAVASVLLVYYVLEFRGDMRHYCQTICPGLIFHEIA